MSPLLKLRVILILGLSLFIPACRAKPPRIETKPTPTPIIDTRKSVVKVFATIQNVDFYEPWKPGSADSLEGCGSILPDGRILTNSHLVDKANYIEVQKFGETKRYVAKVEKLGWDLDMALLSVEEKDFSTGTLPIEFGEMPQPGEKVVLQGGDELSKKEDTISGLDMVWAWEGASFVPALVTNSDIDVKIFGCPVVKDGKFVGLPFGSWYKDKKNGSIIPVPIVKRFLRAVEGNKNYEGLSDLGVNCQNLKSPDLRDFYRLPADKTGIVITQVLEGGAGEGILQEGDVLTALNDQVIDNEGYIQLDKLERVSVDYVIALILPGENLPIDLFRAGQALRVNVTLKTEPKLVPYRADNRHPSYFMIAGFIFVPLTYNYMLSMDWNNLKPELKEISNHGLLTSVRKQVVLLSHVLPADINKGYHYFNNIVVDKVNGQPISEFKDLITAFEKPMGGKHVIEFDDHSWTGSRVIFDAKKAKASTREIMKTLNIPADRSEDLK